MPPLTQTSVIEHLQFVGDDERNDTTAQALLKHDETPNASITILERVYLLEANMKIENVFQRVLLLGVVTFYQSLHAFLHPFWLTRVRTAHLVGQTLVVANGKPILTDVGCA